MFAHVHNPQTLYPAYTYDAQQTQESRTYLPPKAHLNFTVLWRCICSPYRVWRNVAQHKYFVPFVAQQCGLVIIINFFILLTLILGLLCVIFKFKVVLLAF